MQRANAIVTSKPVVCAPADDCPAPPDAPGVLRAGIGPAVRADRLAATPGPAVELLVGVLDVGCPPLSREARPQPESSTTAATATGRDRRALTHIARLVPVRSRLISSLWAWCDARLTEWYGTRSCIEVTPAPARSPCPPFSEAARVRRARRPDRCGCAIPAARRRRGWAAARPGRAPPPGRAAKQAPGPSRPLDRATVGGRMASSSASLIPATCGVVRHARVQESDTCAAGRRDPDGPRWRNRAATDRQRRSGAPSRDAAPQPRRPRSGPPRAAAR
jgi:hypothetical protein